MFAWIAVVIGVAWVGARLAWGYPSLGRRYRVLPRPQVAALAAVSEAMFPAGGRIPSSGLDADLPAYIDRWMDQMPRGVRVQMHLLFFLIEHATLIFPAPGRHRRRRFSSLTLEQQIAVLEAWGASPLYPRRLVFLSLRSILTMGYFAHPPVLRQLEVAPLEIETPVVEADLLYPPIGKLPADIPWSRADLTAPKQTEPLSLDGPLHPDYREPTP